MFQPSAGSVAFGSAADGWAFTLEQFAHMYSAKLGAKPGALAGALWGDWAYAPKERRVVRVKRRPGRGQPRTMFVQFALEPLWRAYSVCEGEPLQVCFTRTCTHACSTRGCCCVSACLLAVQSNKSWSMHCPACCVGRAWPHCVRPQPHWRCTCQVAGGRGRPQAVPACSAACVAAPVRGRTGNGSGAPTKPCCGSTTASAALVGGGQQQRTCDGR